MTTADHAEAPPMLFLRFAAASRAFPSSDKAPAIRGIVTLTIMLRPVISDWSERRIGVPRRYEPGVFSSLYETAFGEALWAFLNEPETLAMLKTAAALDRPGVEGIEEPLLDCFKRDIMDDRAKQMCGHMVRQIMEAEGYRVGVQNTKIRNGGPFSRGTKYRKKDEVIMHSFRNSAEPRLFALAASKSGHGLPRDKGSWSYHQPVKGSPRISMLTMSKAATVIDAVEREGYFLYRLNRIMRPAT